MRPPPGRIGEVEVEVACVAVPVAVLVLLVVLAPVVTCEVVAEVVVRLTLGPSACKVFVLSFRVYAIAKTEAKTATVRAIRTGQPQSLSASGRAWRQRCARLALPLSSRRAPQVRQYS
jgi:ABC-type arginine transport system permease subunit